MLLEIGIIFIWSGKIPGLFSSTLVKSNVELLCLSNILTALYVLKAKAPSVQLHIASLTYGMPNVAIYRDIQQKVTSILHFLSTVTTFNIRTQIVSEGKHRQSQGISKAFSDTAYAFPNANNMYDLLGANLESCSRGWRQGREREEVIYWQLQQ